MFHEAQPLDMEWFGGIDSSTPPNDLPPFSAVTANNCVFLESAVGSRPGVTLVHSDAPASPAAVTGINSIVPVTTRYGAVVVPRVFLGFEIGWAHYYNLTTPPLSGAESGARVGVRSILTGSQFYQRAVLCRSGASGYGEFAAMVGDPGYGTMRAAAPGAPTLGTTPATGSVTPGVHLVALSARYVDGSESRLGETASVTVVGTGNRINVAWTIGDVPAFSHVDSVSLWMTPAGAPEDWRRIANYAPLALAATITASDEAIIILEAINRQGRTRAPRWPATAASYAGRLGYFGERHRAVAGWREGGSQGTDFGLGRTAFDATAVPGGWTVTAGTGGGTTYGTAAVVFDGVAATPVRYENRGAVLYDLPGVARYTTSGWDGTFGVRISFAIASATASGGLKWGVMGTTGTTSVTTALSGMEAGVVHTLEQTISSSFSTNLRLFVEGVGPGAAGEQVLIFGLEVFDPTNTSHKATVWWSDPYQARSIDGLYGAQTFGPEDGETAWLGFEWQGRFYVAKDSSLWVTQKTDGEPIDWPQEKVSDLIGACGRRAIGHGPDFKVLVNKAGAWLFQGAAVGPEANLAKDIPVEWAAINWDEAWQIWLAVDEANERVYIGVPTGASTFCNVIYVLDYHGGFGPGAEASGRRWAVWPMEARGGAMVTSPGGQAELWISRYDGGAYSDVGKLDPTATQDWGTTNIPWLYETGSIGAGDGALGLYRRLTLTAEGNGILSPALVKADGTLVALPSPTLYTPMRGTQHLLCNVKDERVAIRLATSGTSARILLHRLSLWMRRFPFGAYRARTP